MSTQPQPDPGPHLRHNSHQQLPVRASSSSGNVLVSSTMQGHPRRTAPEDSNSLRQQSQVPMDTVIPPQLPSADKGENNRQGAAEGDMSRMLEQESNSREERPQSKHNGDSGFESIEAGASPSPPPENPGNSAMLEWKMQFGPLGESAALGVGDGADGALGEIDRESIADSGAHKSVSEDWFNALNCDVGRNNYATLDDDPPYYLPNPYKKSNLGSISRYTRLNKIYTTRSSKAGMKRLHPAGSILIDSTEESNSDSFRSVIDDLTIKNQKLKKRLKKLEGLHGGNSDEKLFEVRMHGLPLHKKQELERLLQGFASTLDNGASPASSSKKSRENLMAPSLPSINPSSSLNIADSAYVSNSRSGANSVAPSSHAKTKSHVTRSSPASDRASSGSGMSSSSLVAVTSERNKMKEIVRKMEQLFTGFKSKHSGSTPESTNSDRSGSNIGNVRLEEGAREASIMNPLQDKQAAEFKDRLVVPRSEPHAIGSVEIKDQRPTRPKDLDPKRLAKAEDNIEYLSNLTHSAGTGAKTAEMVGDGWFYLNLIINMAQLHTISVTIPFIQKSIQTTSEKLELSKDGKLVRWKGGLESTRLSSESSSGSGVDSASITSDGSPEDSWDSMRKRSPDDSDGHVMSIDPQSKSGSRGRASSSSRRFPAFLPASVGNKFHYKPMFPQLAAFDDDTSSTLSTSMGSFPRGSSDEGGMSSVTKRTTHLDGPIIYYEGGKFCTDLTTQVVKDGKYMSGLPYERFTNNPIGEKPSHVPSSPNTKRESPLFSKDTPPSIPPGNDSMNIDANCEVGLVFAPQFSSSVPQTPPPPMELEASGIGGVLPDDNFTINVQKRHFLLPQNANGALPCSRKKWSKSRILRKISHQIPKSSIDASKQNWDLTESGVSSDEESCTSEHEEISELDSGEEHSAESRAVNSAGSDSESSEPATYSAKARWTSNRHKITHPELVSARMLRLEPSSLPPANYIYPTPSDETSSGDTDSGADPQSSSSEGFIRNCILDQTGTDIYGNSDYYDDDLGSGTRAANGMRIHRPLQPTTESGDAGSSAATAGDASACPTPTMVPVSEANMVPPPMLNVMDSSNWGDSPDSETSGAQFLSSAGDDEDNFGMLVDRPTLKRGRGAGTSPSESTIGLVRKTARKNEKIISLDDTC